MEFLEQFAECTTPDGCDVYVPVEHVNLHHVTAVPYTFRSLIDAAVVLCTTAQEIRMVMDFTHDACRKKFKLGVIGFAGMHFARGQWKDSIIAVESL